MLVTCEELAQNPDWKVFDCRHVLLDPDAGPREYSKGHIPGARHAHIDRDLAGPVGGGAKGRHPLPIAGAFKRFLETYAVEKESKIVVYDGEGGWWASRFWWLCRDHGLQASLLDGGMTRWKALGLPTSNQHEARVAMSHLEIEPGAMPVVDANDVAGGKPTSLVDVRLPERFRGDVEPVDKKAGHIVGAINIPFTEHVNENMTWKKPEEIRATFEAAGVGAGAAFYCGSGVTSTHGIFAMEYAGMPTPALYPGSWSEWLRRPES